MNLESPISKVDKSTQEVFDFLNDVKNFEKIMPENMSKFELVGNDGFVFALSGMPEIELKKKAITPPNQLVLGAAGGKIDFNLSTNITKISENTSEVQFTFDGEFNAMIAMMIKGPINKLIETFSINLPKEV